MSTMSKRTLPMVAALLIGLASFDAANAQQVSRYVHVEKVRTDDVDPYSEAGARVIYARLERAVWRVCRAHISRTGIELGKCRKQLLTDVIADTNLPALTAIHNRTTHARLSASR